MSFTKAVQSAACLRLARFKERLTLRGELQSDIRAENKKRKRKFVASNAILAYLPL